MKTRLFLLTVLVLAFAAVAMAADDRFTGTWRTKNDAFAQLRQITIAPVEGGVSIQQGDGKPEIFLYGKETLLAEGTTANAVRVDDHTFKTTISRDGKILSSQTGTVSADGKHYTVLIESGGQTMSPRPFERVGPDPSGDAFFGTWKQNVVPTIYVLKVDNETFDWTMNGAPRLTAKFDGNEYADTRKAMTRLRRIDVHTIEMIAKIPAPKIVDGTTANNSRETKTLWQVKDNTLTLTSFIDGIQATVMEFERLK